MGDKEKIPGKEYVAYCQKCGWLTADEVSEGIAFYEESEESRRIKKKKGD